MDKYTHFVKLTPLGRFCFGGESYADKDEKVFYLQRSRDFPQQTSVLGLLRYQLLKQSQLLEYRAGRERMTDEAIKLGKAELLIGGRGFDPENCPAGFGVIKQLSPTFITHQNHKHLIPFPKVKAWEDEQKKEEMLYHLPKYKASSAGKGYLMGELKAVEAEAKSISKLENYNPKYGLEHGFRECGSGGYKKRCEVFEKDLEPQIGIFKSHTLDHRRETNGEDNPEQEGFFKIQYKSLQEGYAFGCYIHLSGDYLFEGQAMVVFGKERSPFRLEVKPLEEGQTTPFDEPLASVQAGQYLWLASNAKLNPKEIYPLCDAVCSEEESFRCMVSSLDKDCNYYGRPKKRVGTQKPNGKLLLSGRYNLLKRGSLLRMKQNVSREELQQLSDQAFQLIGYNHFLTFNQ